MEVRKFAKNHQFSMLAASLFGLMLTFAVFQTYGTTAGTRDYLKNAWGTTNPSSPPNGAQWCRSDQGICYIQKNGSPAPIGSVNEASVNYTGDGSTSSRVIAVGFRPSQFVIIDNTGALHSIWYCASHVALGLRSGSSGMLYISQASDPTYYPCASTGVDVGNLENFGSFVSPNDPGVPYTLIAYG